MNQQHKCQLRTLGYVRNYHSEYQSSDIITHTLFHKYASSQNYYYTKEINDILARNRTSATIKFFDDLQFYDEDECMKRIYYFNEYFAKIKLLTEFYKYHNDLPRFGVHKEIVRILNLYYDKKRKLEYYKIQRQIEQENQKNPDQPPKGIVGDKPIESESTPQSDSSDDSTVNNNVENILQDIIQQTDQNQISQQEISNITKIHEEQKSEIMQMLSLLNPQVNQKNVQKYQVFKKKNPTFKKSLKLDEFALSVSSRMHNKQHEIRAPQSARFASYSMSRIYKPHSQEKTENQVVKDNLVYLFNKYPQMKRIRIENKIDQKRDLKNSIPDVKQLELKIIKSLNEMEKNKNPTKPISSMDSKALHQILSKVNQPTSQRIIKKMESFKSQSNQSIKLSKQLICQEQFVAQTPKHFQKILTPKSSQNISKTYKKTSLEKQQMKALDLKKLMVYQQEKPIKTDRSKRSVPKLNLKSMNFFNNNQSSLTSRNQNLNPSFAQLLTPKPMTVRSRINNLINWQVKVLQSNKKSSFNK